MQNKINIAIDGFSSCGKSTLAKQLAKELKYIYVDTGAMYRAITLFAIENQYISTTNFDKQGLIKQLNNIKLNFEYNDIESKSDIILNGRNIENKIRSLEVSNLVSEISQLAKVRQKMVKQQVEISKNKGVVMDGRDIGSVVLSNAELKLFMTATPEIRAERRYKELIEKGEKVELKEIIENINKRDYLDQNRTESPLIQAKDAIILDNTNVNQEEQFKVALNLAKKIIFA
jgi:cytidylate kinase